MRTRNAILAACLLTAGGGMALAEEAGLAEYQNACASCHGASAMGDGPMAEFMTLKVPNLRTLSADNDGVFPMLDVIHVIDGRTGVRGHGTEMPIWGAAFRDEIAGEVGRYGGEVAARGRILSLAYYLESIQDG